ncbi:MAG: TolC family protein [Phycisphaerales bacterium]|nr:TolC family protein [Phycisphaerales bacterium]
MNDPTTTTRRIGMATVLLAASAIAACRGPLVPGEDVPVRYDPRQLRTVDPVEMNRLSKRPPVSVEQGTREAEERFQNPGPPPPSMDIDLAQARASALEHNLDLKVELYNPTIAETQVNVEEARFEWTFFADARRSVRDAPAPTATIANQSANTSFDGGLTIPLQTGGTITATLPFSEQDTDNVFNLVNPAYSAAARFSISQPLLRNAGFRVNTAPIRVAKYQSQIATARTKLEAIRILANVDKAYWAHYAARRELEVQRQRYELAVDQLERARRQVEAGTGAEVDVIRAEAGVADTLSSIITADTALRIRERDLKRIMNRPDLSMDSSVALDPTTQPSPVGFTLDPEQLANRAVENRMEMLELELQLAIDATDIDVARNQELPLFLLDFSYGLNGLDSSYSGAFRQVGRAQYDDWTLGLRAEIPLGNEAAKAGLERAILTRVQRLATRDLRRQAIRQEVFDAVDRLREQWLRILAARQQVILSGRSYEAEKRQFELGLRTSTDVLDAATQLADAQTREVAALADYQVAQVDIAFATGTLLGNVRVEWEPEGVPER